MAADAETWGARVDSVLDDRLRDFKDETGLSKSETVRELLRRGVETERPDGTSPHRLYARVTLIGAGVFMILGLLSHGLYDVFGVSVFETGALGSATLGAALLLSWGYSEYRAGRDRKEVGA